DPKTGKTKTKKAYFYPVTIPRVGLILSLDPSAKGDKGLWIKLWRDMVWGILRGVPATREPFEARAQWRKAGDAEKIWEDLLHPAQYSIELPSTYFLGAQASTAENVPFMDRARFQFLLHFWPFVAQIYVPALVNNDGKQDFVGYALSIPDVCD